MATQPGRLTLPEVHVTWFDVEHQQIKSASVPARTLQVTGAATTSPPKQDAPRPERRAQSNNQRRQMHRPGTSSPGSKPLRSIVGLPVAAAIALIGMGRSAIWRQQTPPGAPSIRANVETAAYRAVCRACEGGDPGASAQRSTHWLMRRYAAPLAEATRRFTSDANARDALHALNARLYQRDAVDFDAKRVCADASTTPARTREHGPRSDVLPALYPTA